MALQPRWLLVSVAIGGLTNALITKDASAHIKWFCAFDVAGQPRSLRKRSVRELRALGRRGNIDPAGRLPVRTYAHGCGSAASA